MSETKKQPTESTDENNEAPVQSNNEAKRFIQTVVKDTGAYDAMDDANKKAADVMEKDGAEAAAKYMMNMAGGDYARMRMMYG